MIYSYWQLQQFLILAIPVIHEIAFYYTHSVSLVVVVFVGGGSGGGCCALHLRCYCGLNSDRFMIWQFISLSLVVNISQQPSRQYLLKL